MRKLIWAIITIILLVFTIYTGFNSPDILSYIFYCIIVTAVPLIIIYKAEKIMKEKKDNNEQSLKDRNNKLVVLFSITFIFILFFLLLPNIPIECFPEKSQLYPKFYTNILDNTCKLEVFMCGDKPPWYYSKDCNISFEQKMDILRNSSSYTMLENECTDRCVNTNIYGSICESDKINPIIQGFSCNDIIQCDKNC